jgi:predicted nuclease with TOPRIM domain
MPDEKLRRSLEELRSELERLEAEEAQVRERLSALIAGVETRLEKPEDSAHHQSLVQDLRQSISQFEVSNPRATAILNQIMVTLGNMGI